MITHGLNKYLKGNGRMQAWCGVEIDKNSKLLERGDIDCMTCLVVEARKGYKHGDGDIWP